MATLHVGHRQRLKNRYAKEGLQNFQPHEVLELLLFYSIPQRDVNPLAHLLIERFGSLEGVLRADIPALLEVPGIGEKTARWLTALPDILDVYKRQTLLDRPLLSTLRGISNFCTEKLSGRAGETWLYTMNMAGYLINSALIANGSMHPQATAREIADHAIRYRAQCFVLVELRTPELMAIGSTDIEMTRYVSDALLSIRIPMVDHLLISGSRVHSMRERGILYPEPAPTLNERTTKTVLDTWLSG